MVLNDISIEQLLCQAVALTDQEQLAASFPASTAFTNLDADIRVAGGRAQLDPLRPTCLRSRSPAAATSTC